MRTSSWILADIDLLLKLFPAVKGQSSDLCVVVLGITCCDLWIPSTCFPSGFSKESKANILLKHLMGGRCLQILARNEAVLTMGSVLLTCVLGGGEQREDPGRCGMPAQLNHCLIVSQIPHGLLSFQKACVTSLDSRLYIGSPPVSTTVNN